MFGRESGVFERVHGGEEVVVSSFFDRALPRRAPDAQVSAPGEQVSWRLADERRERIEEARKRAKNRTGGRHD